MDILFIFLLDSIYFLNMFHIVSLLYFLIDGVKSRSGHDRCQSFGPILYVSNPTLVFSYNFQMILHGFASRSPKNIVFFIKNMVFDQKSWFFLFVGLKTLLFGLLDAKPCRTIIKLPQKVSVGAETCEIWPKLWLRSCPDLLLTP